jgi:mannosyltransferase
VESVGATVIGNYEDPHDCPTLEEHVKRIRPLYWFVLKGWMALLGTSEAAIRSLSVLFGIVAIWLLFQLGRALFGLPVAAVASLLLATSGLFVWYMQEARMYTLLVLMTLLSYLLYVRILQGGGSRTWWMYLACALGTILTHPVGLLVFASQIAHYALFHVDRRFIVRNVKYIALAAVVVLGLFALSAQRILTKFAISPAEWAHPYLLSFHTVFGNYVVGMHTWYTSAYPWPVVLVGLFGLFFVLGCFQLPVLRSIVRRVSPRGGRRPEDVLWPSGRSVALLLLWLFFATILAWMGTGLTHMWQIRYTLAGLPAFLLLASLGWVQLVRWRGKWGLFTGIVALGALLVLNGSSLYDYYTTSKKPDFRQAAHAIQELQETSPSAILGWGTDSRSPLLYYGVSGG